MQHRAARASCCCLASFRPGRPWVAALGALPFRSELELERGIAIEIHPQFAGNENSAAVRVFLDDDLRVRIERTDSVKVCQRRHWRLQEVHADMIDASRRCL